jgi:MFS family permease|tara:strand:- start:170 stop:1360 length:1191 start_codon:yes stop_codon:yes gene_type:complete
VKSEEKKRLQGNIWKSYVFQIFSALAFFVPIIVLFWQENGLSLTEVMILQSLFSLTVVFLEVPSGYVADIFGRKKALISAGFFLTIGIFVYSFGHNFYQFLIAEMLWAFGVSFVSGTDSALIYDTLTDLKKESTFKKVMGNVFFYSLIATSIASIIGGFIGKIDFRWTFYLMIPFMILLIPLAFSLKEPKRHKIIFERGYLVELIKILKYSFVENIKLRWLIIYSAVIMGFNGAILWLYQPYFQLSGLDILHFGFVFAAFNLVAALSSKYAHKIEEKMGQKYSLMMLIILTGGSYLLMSNFIYLFSFCFAFLQQFVRGYSKPVITDYINKLTTSDVRATVLSAQNLMGRLFYSAIIPVIGWIADVYTLIQAITVLGITTLIVGVGILFILHKNKVV